MARVGIYGPNGFIIGDNATKIKYNPVVKEIDVVWSYDHAITPLIERYDQCKGDVPGELFMAICKQAAYVIQDPETWVLINAKQNRNITEEGIGFMVDCLSFAKTGMRKLNTTTWLTILATQSTDRWDAPVIDHSAAFANVYIPTMADLISSWIGQRKGFDDLVQSLRILTTRI